MVFVTQITFWVAQQETTFSYDKSNAVSLLGDPKRIKFFVSSSGNNVGLCHNAFRIRTTICEG